MYLCTGMQRCIKMYTCKHAGTHTNYTVFSLFLSFTTKHTPQQKQRNTTGSPNRSLHSQPSESLPQTYICSKYMYVWITSKVLAHPLAKHFIPITTQHTTSVDPLAIPSSPLPKHCGQETRLKSLSNNKKSNSLVIRRTPEYNFKKGFGWHPTSVLTYVMSAAEKLLVFHWWSHISVHIVDRNNLPNQRSNSQPRPRLYISMQTEFKRAVYRDVWRWDAYSYVKMKINN